MHDASHTPHRLQTTLNAGQQESVVYLRRREVSKLPELEAAPQRLSKPFKADEPGCVHVDVKYLPQMQGETERRLRLCRRRLRHALGVHRHQAPPDSGGSARSFLNAPGQGRQRSRSARNLTDNGSEFTDRLFGARARQPSGQHAFDRLCQALAIEHRLTKPRTPQTSGMVERFNGRLSQVAAHAPLPLRRGPADHAAPLRRAVQRAPAAEGAGAHGAD